MSIYSISFAQQDKKPAQKAKPVSKTTPAKTDAQLYAEQMRAEAKPVKVKTPVRN